MASASGNHAIDGLQMPVTALRVNLDIDEAEDELVLSTAPRPCSTPPKRPSDHA
jgi:hypothetical protein